MHVTARSLARMRRNLRRHLGKGWERAVFSAPQRPGETVEHVVVEHGELDLDQLLAAAERAAEQGLVKQTYVIDGRTRVQIDARHGAAKLQLLDEARLAKITGGKARPIGPDRSGALLRVIGIMNQDGSISAQNAKKYKQVNHLVELCRPTWQAVGRARALTTDDPLRVIDLACGNSYLTLVLAEALRLAEVPARLVGVDVRTDVIERSRRRADELGFEELKFFCTSLATLGDARSLLGGPTDLVVCLHACDTATDDALAWAIANQAGAVLAVPCCQHELAGQMRRIDGAVWPLPAIGEHGLLLEDYAALLTDALRIDVLEACGYSTTSLEFVPTSHTPKNLLIRAVRTQPGAGRDRNRSLATIRTRCAAIGIQPRLLRLV